MSTYGARKFQNVQTVNDDETSMMLSGTVHGKFLENMGVFREAGRGRGEADGGQLVHCGDLHAVTLQPGLARLAHQGGPHQV